MNFKIKINKGLEDYINNILIKFHDDTLIENKQSKIDWFIDDVGDGMLECEIYCENLRQNELEYLIGTLGIIQKNVKK